MKAYDKYVPSGVEWIGNIPEGWEVKKLKYIVKTKITDGPHTTPEFVPDGVPFVSAEAVKNNRINLDLIRGYISKDDHKEFCLKCKPQRNDIFMIKSGATTGNIAIVDFDTEFSIWSPLALIRAKENYYEQRYVFYSMLSDFFAKQVSTSWSFGTQQNIGMGVIENLIIFAPSKNKQQDIANYLDTETARIDKLIKAKETLIERLKEKRTALITNAVTKGINPNAKMKPSGIEWIGDIPEDWEVKKLKYLAKNPLMYGANESPDTFDENQPRYIRITDIDENGKLRQDIAVSLEIEKAKPYLLEMDDILFARSGATVGKSYIFKEQLLACFAGYMIKFKPNTCRILPEFAYYVTFSKFYLNWVESNTIQATIQNVSAEKYKNFYFALPCIHEQEAIVTFLDSEATKIDSTIDKTQSSIEKLKEYRTALISACVTGKIDVRSV